ncbi:hypothetical protein E2C01_044885 [Portunus trituberculatus]|uniref:Uncharacterized protein n=1 Tax=Portunus trituberculatus TaxID=210409 RepID=A0A5B7G1P4_PORTR|nr:hypothetical protein [Portunus trituberculatus]
MHLPHTQTLHLEFKIQNEMSPGRTALSVATQNILTPPSTFFFINFCNIRCLRYNDKS